MAVAFGHDLRAADHEPNRFSADLPVRAATERKWRVEGGTWFDDMFFAESGATSNLVVNGDFEVTSVTAQIEVDFSHFDAADRLEQAHLGPNLVRRSRELLRLPSTLCRSRTAFTDDPALLAEHREKVASVLEEARRLLGEAS